ncbi:MAG: DUF2568 domain-containing protein [Solirubrobacteraceae bacterium]
MIALLEALHFLLELCVVAALAWAGAQVGVALAVLAPLAAVAFWGAFGAPRARWHATGAGRLAVLVVFFGAGAVTLAAAGQPVLGAALALAAAADVAALRLAA